MRDTSDRAAASDAARPGEDQEAELERLRMENAKLRQQAGAGRRRHVSWRAPVSLVLIVLGCILAPVAVIGVWAGNEVSDTGRYVATVEPLIHDPAIQNYLAGQITTQITSHLNITGAINQASAQLNSQGLPRISSLLTTFGPQIASAVTGFIHSSVHTVIASKAAATIWVQANTVAHQAVVKVLSGQGNGAISTKNGQIVLNLGPFIAVVKQDLLQHGFSLASNIPPVSPTIALFQAKDLGKAQSLYRLVTTLKIVLPILSLLLIAAGVWVARGRRRALVRAALGVAASMLILGIGLPQGRAPRGPGGRADHRHRGVLHRALPYRGSDPLGADVGHGLGPELRQAQGPVPRSGRPLDVPAPHGPPDRGSGPRRADIRPLERAHRAGGHRDRRRPAHRPGPDPAARRQAAGARADGWPRGVLTPSRLRAEASA